MRKRRKRMALNRVDAVTYRTSRFIQEATVTIEGHLEKAENLQKKIQKKEEGLSRSYDVLCTAMTSWLHQHRRLILRALTRRDERTKRAEQEDSKRKKNTPHARQGAKDSIRRITGERKLKKKTKRKEKTPEGE